MTTLSYINRAHSLLQSAIRQIDRLPPNSREAEKLTGLILDIGVACSSWVEHQTNKEIAYDRDRQTQDPTQGQGE